jgi:hypothetical protein
MACGLGSLADVSSASPTHRGAVRHAEPRPRGCSYKKQRSHSLAWRSSWGRAGIWLSCGQAPRLSCPLQNSSVLLAEGVEGLQPFLHSDKTCAKSKVCLFKKARNSHKNLSQGNHQRWEQWLCSNRQKNRSCFLKLCLKWSETPNVEAGFHCLGNGACFFSFVLSTFFFNVLILWSKLSIEKPTLQAI